MSSWPHGYYIEKHADGAVRAIDGHKGVARPMEDGPRTGQKGRGGVQRRRAAVSAVGRLVNANFGVTELLFHVGHRGCLVELPWPLTAAESERALRAGEAARVLQDVPKEVAREMSSDVTYWEVKVCDA